MLGLLAALLAEVGLDDLAVRGDLFGRVFRNHPSEVQHRHPICELADDLHMVFDQEHRGTERAHPLHERDELSHLGGVHARGRLVEDQQVGIGGERTSDLEPALIGKGKRACTVVCAFCEADEAQQSEGACVRAALPRPQPHWKQQRTHQIARRGRMRTDEHVLENRHPPPDLTVLKRTRDADASAAMR